MPVSANRAPTPRVGLAYSAAVHRALKSGRLEVDYVEVPFELLRHDPNVLTVGEIVPIILHCASLSLAGTASCPAKTIAEIERWIEKTHTPWLGEHLAFVTAKRTGSGETTGPCPVSEPYDIGYTVSPVMNSDTVHRVVHSLNKYTERFPVPILVENSPIYFLAPGSSVGQVDFIRDIFTRSDVNLLFDVSHFIITSRQETFDPLTQLERLPIDRLVEVHISGVQELDGLLWDDHANIAPDLAYQMLDRIMDLGRPQAITLEYNWSSRFPISLMSEEISRVRRICSEQHDDA